MWISRVPKPDSEAAPRKERYPNGIRKAAAIPQLRLSAGALSRGAIVLTVRFANLQVNHEALAKTPTPYRYAITSIVHRRHNLEQDFMQK